MKKYLLVTSILLLTNNGFAMFCPTNFKQIEIGDSMQQVIQMCGNPNSQQTVKRTNILSEEWTYYVRTQVGSMATSKMRVVISNGKVVNINLDSSDAIKPIPLQSATPQPTINFNFNNQPSTTSVASTTACGTVIHVGDTADQVKNSCGNPVFVKQNAVPGAQGETEVTEFIYGGPNAATLIFENGIFKERRQQ